MGKAVLGGSVVNAVQPRGAIRTASGAVLVYFVTTWAAFCIRYKISTYSSSVIFGQDLLYRACMKLETLLYVDIWAIAIASSAVLLVRVYVTARNEIQELLRKK